MNIKEIWITLAIGTLVAASLVSVSMASSEEPAGKMQANANHLNEHLHYRLDKLSERLEIKASQQAVWEEYANSVMLLAEHKHNRPDPEADAATIARSRADRAADIANKLAVIADATAKLQKVLTEDQRKIFNQVSQFSLHRYHKRHAREHDMHQDGMHHENYIIDGHDNSGATMINAAYHNGVLINYTM